MGILLDEPKFPVIERAPSAATTISNFNLTDWLRVTAVTSASIPVGYLAGAIRNCLPLFPLSVLNALVSLLPVVLKSSLQRCRIFLQGPPKLEKYVFH
jgi:hypothetical protein